MRHTDTTHGTAIGLPIKPDPISTTPNGRATRQFGSPRRVVSGTHTQPAEVEEPYRLSQFGTPVGSYKVT